MESHILLFHVIGILSGLNAILRARTAEGGHSMVYGSFSISIFNAPYLLDNWALKILWLPKSAKELDHLLRTRKRGLP